jgi:hypothetical protein
MKKITFQSDKFYALVSYLTGPVTYKFSSQEEQDKFIEEVEQSAEFAYTLTPLQIKLEVHKQMSIKSPLGLPLYIVKSFTKDGKLTDGVPSVWTYQPQLINVINELSPYLLNKHGYPSVNNLEVVIREELILARKWYSKSISKFDKYVSYSTYVRGVLYRIT